MTKTMNHTECDHPATKAARAKCRKIRADRAAAYTAAYTAAVKEIKEGYYSNTLDNDELIGMIYAIAPHLMDPDTDLDGIIASL